MTVRIASKRNGGGFDGTYIGRPSPLGNPFTIGRDGDREAVIAQYRVWLTSIWNAGGKNAQLNELMRLAVLAREGDLTLVCWCAPKQCHGDVIADFIKLINKGAPS